MAELQPFSGVRYDPAAIGGDLSPVLAPPFDVITPEEQDALYHRSPFNIIRVEYSQASPDDTPDQNRYTRAAEALQSWRKEGKLRQDSTPALYLVRHEFLQHGQMHVRRELIATIRLEPWERGVVLPHEHTLPQAKADRLQLYRAARSNISPVFSLYADPGGAVAAVLDLIEQSEPTITSGWGTSSVQLWTATDREHITSIQNALAGQHLYIADGHHRYETALNYAQERESEDPNAPADAAFRYVMMGLVAASDPGLLLLPLHRVVRGLSTSDVEVLRGRLEGIFEVTEIPFAGDVAESSRAIEGALASESARRPTLALYGLEPGRVLLLGTLDAAVLRRRFMPEDWPEALRDLDVALLHHVILEPMLGITQESANQGMMAFEPDIARAIRAVDDGHHQLAFLLNPTRVDQVLAVADAGEKMPAKSTFFFPKLPTGLVLHPLDGTH